MSVTKNSDDYDEKHMKIKFNSNDELALNKKCKVKRNYLLPFYVTNNELK